MKIKTLIIISVLLFGSAVAAKGNIEYPVQELGGCKSEVDCKSYCDNPENGEACLSFAQKNNLMSDQEIKVARKFLEGEANGPGGCKTKDSCEDYCNNIDHIDECISFAEKNDLLPAGELQEAKKVQSAIARGVKPPPCGNKKACDAYCESSDHMEECVTFGLEAGFIQGKEAEDAQKMLQAVKRGVKPPPCKGKEACDEYCSKPDNMEVCINFAMEAGFMSDQEKGDAQKMLQAVKRGVKPPPCKGKEECDSYCQQDEHFEECTNFAVAAGFMSEKDAEMARKTGGKGPGGCKGKEECELFCNNPENQETCFNFAKDNGLMPEEDLKRIEGEKQKFKDSLGQMPQEALDCLKSEVGEDIIEKMKNGAMPSKEIGEKIRGCFEKIGPPTGQEGEMQPGQPGPGGCQNPEECKKYCEENPEGCKDFRSGPGEENPGGQIMPQQAGPGGCKSPEECQKYCENNPEECKNFGSRENNQQGPNRQGPKEMPPCEGENCKYGPPPAGSQEQLPLQCQGENCQFGPQQGQQPPSPTIEPKEGENFAPKEQIPQIPPAEQQPLEIPAPPPPGAYLKPDTFLGAVLYTIARALYSLRLR